MKFHENTRWKLDGLKIIMFVIFLLMTSVLYLVPDMKEVVSFMQAVTALFILSWGEP